MKPLKKPDKNWATAGFISVLPVIAIILIIRGYPLLIALVKSFTDWDGITPGKWVGLSNYLNILKHGDFWLLLRNNLIILTYIPIQFFAGVIVAVLLYEEVPGWRFFRSLYYLPQIISAVIVAFLFRVFFGYDGPINVILRALRLDSMAIEWLGNGFSSLFVIIICLVWINIGWQAILVLGGMSSIPTSVLEAARIDGAGYWKRLFGIIIPMITRVIEYSSIISVIWVFTGLFPFIYSLTNGGPGYETTTIDYMIYLKAFVTGTQMGYACAIAVILLFIILIFTRIQMTIANHSDDWSE